MNSALKPVLPGVPQPGAGGQGSPAKGNVANANHSVGLPQGAQNSLHHPTNSLVGQNLTHHVPNVPQAAPHPVPSMAPVSANMAQMAQNMSHHGNLSHVTQNSTPPPVLAPSPSKPATSSPLSLVQDKPQPLALTRTPEKKEPDSTGQSNGTIEAPKSASNAPAPLKAQNPETNKDKQDIAKTSPSTPKPPEKPASAQNTPQKIESAAPASQADTPAQPKVATASEAPEKSPSKPAEPKPAPTADVAPTQSDSKPVPESAKDSQEKPNATANKVEPSVSESAKIENPVKPEEKKEEPKVEKPIPNAAEEKKEDVKADKAEPPKKEEPVAEKQEKEQKPQKVEEKEKTEEKKPEPKPEVKTPAKPEVAKATPKSTLKLATVTPTRKRRASPKVSDGPTPAKKAADGDSAATPDARTRRNRTQVQLYQSPTPEIAMATKLSASAGRATPTKPNDDKLIVFYKNEYLAVRNAEGGFYVCQTMQNVYRTTRKIKIRWLSQDKAADPSGETYKPDFYDTTDMECVLTTLSLTRASNAMGAGAWCLRAAEAARARSILGRALKAERGDTTADLTEEHPDGLDLSLYTDESQLEKKSRKRAASKSSPRKQETSDDAAEAAPSAKRPRPTPKRSPKSALKPKQTPPKQNNKRKSAGSTPNVASISKTATAVSESPKSSPRTNPAKRTPKPAPAPVATPTRLGRRAAKADPKPAPAPAPAPTPSTSTGKAPRTPRKPPAKK